MAGVDGRCPDLPRYPDNKAASDTFPPQRAAHPTNANHTPWHTPYMCVLDHQKASEALHDLSFKIKRLSFLPEMNLHNICSFQELMTKFCDHYGELRNIQAFCYVFPCDFARKHNEVDIFGTGGSILDGMKSLLMKLPGLKKVELIDLQLDVVDGIHFLTHFLFKFNSHGHRI